MFRCSKMAWILVLVMSAIVEAQEIRVIKKGEDTKYSEWTVSYSRKNGPTVFELDSSYPTEEEARARAKALIVWSDSMQSGSEWRLAVIKIEGEPDGTANPDPADNTVLRPNRRPGDVLREYSKVVATAYKNAKELRISLTSKTASISESEFKRVNKIITDYNSQRQSIKAETGYYFSSAPALAVVTPGELRAKITQQRERTEPKEIKMVNPGIVDAAGDQSKVDEDAKETKQIDENDSSWPDLSAMIDPTRTKGAEIPRNIEGNWHPENETETFNPGAVTYTKGTLQFHFQAGDEDGMLGLDFADGVEMTRFHSYNMDKIGYKNGIIYIDNKTNSASGYRSKIIYNKMLDSLTVYESRRGSPFRKIRYVRGS
ncbi:hypothetical protein [Singulisphaera sp. PoT]|uniref:hypothetical protein n=1 Tax=Singulisphaera sp. PoT TaxID=3411797 RepID=UPI003BF543C3